MAGKNKKRRPKRKTGLVALMILLIILIIFAALAVFISKRFAPSKVQTDLHAYYNLNADSANEREEAKSDELAIVLEDKILTSRAIREGGEVYIPYRLIYENIDNRFYVDIIEDVLIFTTADEFIAADVEGNTYTINGAPQDAGYKIATYRGNALYVNVKYVDKYSTAHYQVFENPDRVCVWYQTGEFNYVNAKSGTFMRVRGGIKSDVVTKVESGAKLKVLEDLDDWLEVIDESGYRGYVQTSTVTEVRTEEVTSDYSEPEYTHIDLGTSINMVWDAIYSEDNNYELERRTESVTGLNIISPTWLSFLDEYGNIGSTASKDYVDYAHGKGWKVLPLINDFDGVNSIEVFTRTSRRKAAIENLVSLIKEIGADGINIDFETVPKANGDDFIEFMRELSIVCRANNLLFTSDNYAPYNFNSHYQIAEQSKLCDYVAVMAYDDYVGEAEAGPNASLSFVKEVLNLCKDKVDMSRLIVGIPFYSRVWFEYTDGTLDSETYTMNGIEDILIQHGLTANWIEDIGYEYCEYDRYDAKVKLWYENAKSIEAKLKLISEYNVAGTSAWVLTQEKPEIWPLLEEYH